MNIRDSVSLRDFSTMRLGGAASHLAEVKTESELKQAISWAVERSLPIVMIGHGSNIVWRDEGFSGLVIVNKIKGFTQKNEGDHVLVTAGSGEVWDDIVGRTATQGLTGIESLSLIPGTIGATPIQNVGAYGQEISDTLIRVRAYDLQKKSIVTLRKGECELKYRSSRFKTTDRGRFFITSVTLQLEKRNPQPPFYPSLQQYLDDHAITTFTPEVIRTAIIGVRSAKLPDPAKVANNGSFFANPVVTRAKLEKLQATHTSLIHWQVGEDLFKIPAAWLVQEAGFKNYHDPKTGMATWPAQALVLVNEHATSTKQLLEFRDKITHAVKKKFGISLVQEPELLPD
ncbi:MAG TPA: UDP-N-acetylmuramate dehydrogenase [Candidatus Saccharimonadales bacterium]|nr:UDP-N-acetylmuramate dehydrogenase [Candidatus Saccharimonadales bacterium]